jgi:hypothetical protein
MLRAGAAVPLVPSLVLFFSPLAARGEEPTTPPAVVFEGIYARADVTAPTGGRFVTEIVSLADGRVRFVQVHPDRRTELLAAGGPAYDRRAGSFEEAPGPALGQIRGHDVHRMVLARGGRPGRIDLPAAPESGGDAVAIELGDWRDVLGTALPFEAAFVHRGERWAYRYTAVLPFRIAPGTTLPAEPAALFERLGDLGAIAALHEEVMAAHRASDAERLAANGAEVATVSGRGELRESRRADFIARMRGYLGAIRFSRYADTAVPVVAVSLDGTMGWLACQMEAEGLRTAEGKTEPIAYAFSWIELYGRPNAADRWTAVGNASSQRP